jgi:hypothetical protein
VNHSLCPIIKILQNGCGDIIVAAEIVRRGRKDYVPAENWMNLEPAALAELEMQGGSNEYSMSVSKVAYNRVNGGGTPIAPAHPTDLPDFGFNSQSLDFRVPDVP